MASIPCSFDLIFPSTSSTYSSSRSSSSSSGSSDSSSSSGSSSSLFKFRSQFLGIPKRLRFFRTSKTDGSRSKCRKNDGTQNRKDFDPKDVVQVFFSSSLFWFN
ncbi:hypothetical protein BVC80_9009g36 [Macleaya cordata]|uniref:Uncharacterized protein n=1 Tax=Macleaya cordata TaxID=56857 RepID=A0A200QM11_MACCD|nr:hypothetical protein BVC80_9009g36 [Macleaya cordata]